jgi:hypothetical protein
VERERLVSDVCLDEEGLIRRAIFHGDQRLMILELSGFGDPDPIELPGSDEILPDEA